MDRLELDQVYRISVGWINVTVTGLLYGGTVIGVFVESKYRRYSLEYSLDCK